jgi:hypothetical protein
LHKDGQELIHYPSSYSAQQDINANSFLAENAARRMSRILCGWWKRNERGEGKIMFDSSAFALCDFLGNKAAA